MQVLYAGVSWGVECYEISTVDADGRSALPVVSFGADRTDEMITYLTSIPHRLATVVDSTNGMIDGRMMAAGLDVYRADPWALPPRPVFGSVSAVDLASAAARDLSQLTRLQRDRGTQTGREDDLVAGIDASAAATDGLIASGRCLANGHRDLLEVALTFDDGPLPPYTGQVLDVLERYGVPATFFCVGLNVSAFPEEVARIREQGHTLGNHTWSHPFLPELSRRQLVAQLEHTDSAIMSASGGARPTLFRPPYGSRTPEVAGWLGELDSTVVLWDVDVSDWSMPGAGVIADMTLAQTKPGSVILMHDGGGDRSQTVAALPAIIEGVLARGLRFVRVEEMTTPSGHVVRA
jgi:peptidoglycan-N-acetylglucosamine deacetylase